MASELKCYSTYTLLLFRDSKNHFSPYKQCYTRQNDFIITKSDIEYKLFIFNFPGFLLLTHILELVLSSFNNLRY